MKNVKMKTVAVFTGFILWPTEKQGAVEQNRKTSAIFFHWLPAQQGWQVFFWSEFKDQLPG